MPPTFLIIDCGYTSRLLGCPRTGPTDELLAHPNLFAIKDTVWGDAENPPFSLFNGALQKDFDTLQASCPPLDGVIIFRFGSSENAPLVETVKMVASYDFCSFFEIDTIYYQADRREAYEEQGMSYEEAEAKVKEEMREICDEDLEDPESFDSESSDYYCGTLYKVLKIQEKDHKIFILTFDSESG